MRNFSLALIFIAAAGLGWTQLQPAARAADAMDLARVDVFALLRFAALGGVGLVLFGASLLAPRRSVQTAQPGRHPARGGDVAGR